MDEIEYELEALREAAIDETTHALIDVVETLSQEIIRLRGMVDSNYQQELDEDDF